MDIKVVIGSNFGDEGKGLMTDYFCQQNKDKKVLNIRMNGGAQAGHTVVRPNGNRHIFSSLGAGSFSKVDTFWSKDFLINTFIILSEIKSFQTNFGFLPTIYVDYRCQITTLFDMTVNQILEKSRGKDKHGSCGMGIFETWHRVNRNDKHKMSFTIGDVYNLYCLGDRDGINEKLKEIQFKYITFRIKELQLEDKLSEEDKNKLYSEETININTNMLLDLCNFIKVTDSYILKSYDTLVFEGAQGLSLDMENDKYFPHLTPSKTGLKNVLFLIKELNITDDIEVCFVTRSYLTRHGAGDLLTMCDKKLLGNVYDKTNEFNPFQEYLRFGYLDKNELKENIQKEILLEKDLPNKFINSLSVTHLDQTENKIMYENPIDIKKFDLADFGLNGCLYTSNGETYLDIKEVG